VVKVCRLTSRRQADKQKLYFRTNTKCCNRKTMKLKQMRNRGKDAGMPDTGEKIMTRIW